MFESPDACWPATCSPLESTSPYVQRRLISGPAIVVGLDTTNSQSTGTDSEAEPAELVEPTAGEVERDEPLPLVARMIIEIRSDGTRTVARGAVEDAVSGERVAVEAGAGSPLELSMSLARAISQTLATAPSLAAKTMAAQLRQRARQRVDRAFARIRSRLQRKGDG